MRNAKMLLVALLCALLLAGCTQNPAQTTELTTESTTEATTETTTETSATVPPAGEPTEIAIHDIRDWDTLHLPDGYSKEAYAFIGQFLGVCEPDFPELATVQISDYTIRYADAEKTLYFDFTVTASELDTLPPGDYRTDVLANFGLGLGLRFLDGNASADEDFPCEDCRELISDFVMNEHCWNVLDYGTWGTCVPANFIVWHYSDSDWMKLSDYIATAERMLGISADSARSSVVAHTDELGVPVVYGGASGFYAAFDFVGHSITDGVHATTVQYFADASYLIKSHLVEYRIGESGELLGMSVLNRAAYEPWGTLGERSWTD